MQEKIHQSYMPGLENPAIQSPAQFLNIKMSNYLGFGGVILYII